ncbi:MAG: Maf family protein [Vibrionaceae bacterium]
MSLQLYLASASPRRKALLEQLAFKFAVLAADVNEQREHDEPAADYVRRLSLEKAQAGVRVAPQPLPVLGADTIVVYRDEVFEKPKNFADSQRMLRALSGGAHQVLTAISFATPNSHLTTLVSTQVYFKSLSDDEILHYWQTGEPQDKAGSYAIQGIGGKFVTRIEGSFHAVVGLPLYETQQLFEQFLILTREK